MLALYSNYQTANAVYPCINSCIIVFEHLIILKSLKKIFLHIFWSSINWHYNNV